MPGEFHFLFWQPVEHHQQNDARDADFERNRVDAFRMRILFRKILPLIEAESLERTVRSAEHSLGMTFKEQGQGTAGGADVDRLPKTV